VFYSIHIVIDHLYGKTTTVCHSICMKKPELFFQNFKSKKVLLISIDLTLPGIMSTENKMLIMRSRRQEHIFVPKNPSGWKCPLALQMPRVLTLSNCRLTANSALWQLQLSLLSVFSWISWTGSYDVTKIRLHISFFIHFGFENVICVKYR